VYNESKPLTRRGLHETHLLLRSLLARHNFHLSGADRTAQVPGADRLMATLTIAQVYQLLSDTQDKIQNETEFDILSEEYAAVSLAVESLSLAMKSLDRVRNRAEAKAYVDRVQRTIYDVLAVTA
jgi:hypothetical protein